ncbi:MAG: hypothetical protein IJ846_01610 [Alphaproteobacteria bacterium]|nr:hypothetical protein [Alphaproteobacteria bacterium]
MTYLKKSAIFGLVAVSFLFRTGTVQAIPIPTIGAELATQIDQLTKHIDELKKVKDQIMNGIEQAKAMGDKLSMDALKAFATGQAKAALSGGIKALDIPQEMTKAGFSEDVMKDPEKITDVIGKLKKSGTAEDGKFDIDARKVCWEAKESMSKELAKSSLANSFALQQNLADGEDMKKAQEASSASDDQMQQLGALVATMKVQYQQAASSAVMSAMSLANSSLESMCN